MPERTLTVRIVGDDADLRRAFARSEKGAATFSGRIGGATAGVTKNFLAAGVAAGATAVSFQAVTAAISQSVSNASNLAEQISKSRQIFGDSSATIEAWAQTTAKSMGIARTQALEATGTFGNLFRTVGLAPTAAAEMSRSLVKLAADLASFNNASPEDVLQAIRSGLIGEAEPLRRYGVLLSEAKVQQLAMAETGKTNVKALTDQEKALARYHIILRDTAPAQGDFARTSEGLANQSRILKAQLNDLSTNIGGVLVPVLTDAAEAANLLFAALNQMRGIDFSPGFDFPDIPDFLSSAAAIAPISPAGAVAFGFKKAFDDAEKEAKDVGSKGFGGIGEDIARRAEEDAKAVVRAAADVKSAQTRAQKAFRELALGLGLKLDKAGLTDSTNDDIAVLRELERAILRQIDREGKTFKLVDQLTQTRLAISGLAASNAQTAADAVRDAFNETMDSLTLELEVAQTTKSFADDQAALRKIEQAILQRIENEGNTADLARQLFQNREAQKLAQSEKARTVFDTLADELGLKLERAEVTKSLNDDLNVLKEIESAILARIKAEGRTVELARQLFQNRQAQADAIAQQRNANQFVELGLTEEGDKRVPGAGALRSRQASLLDQIKGTALDTPKTRQQLENIGNVLAAEYGKVGRKVRQAILDMLNQISGAMKEGTKDTGEITQGGIRSTQMLLRGLDLSEEERRIIQQRNLGVSGRRGLSAFGTALGGDSFGGGFTGSIAGMGGNMAGAVIINGPVTVVSNDPNDMMKKLQKKGRKSAGGRRGRHGGANLGLQ